MENDESPIEALSREILEELGVRISFDEPYAVEVGDGFAIDDERTLRVFKCALADPREVPILNGSHDEFRWLNVVEWLDVDWLPVDREAVLLLRSSAKS